MGLKEVSEKLGYQENSVNKIEDGLQALLMYEEYLETGDAETKRELLKYNQSDLERTRFIFDYVDSLYKGLRQTL